MKELPEVIALLKLKKDLDNRPKLNFPRFEIQDIIDKHIANYRTNKTIGDRIGFSIYDKK